MRLIFNLLYVALILVPLALFVWRSHQSDSFMHEAIGAAARRFEPHMRHLAYHRHQHARPRDEYSVETAAWWITPAK